MPLAWLSIDTTRSRRSLNILLFTGMKSCGPLSASTDAHCEIDDGFDVDCDWIVAIARSRRSLNILLFTGMKSCGPLSASTDAHCEIDDGFDVDCDWIVAIALISSAGPPA